MRLTTLSPGVAHEFLVAVAADHFPEIRVVFLDGIEFFFDGVVADAFFVDDESHGGGTVVPGTAGVKRGPGIGRLVSLDAEKLDELRVEAAKVAIRKT